VVNGVKFIREIFIYFKESQGRSVSNIKLEGVFVSFEETSREVSVIFPKKKTTYTMFKEFN
jgi:hypothetical protein